MSTSKWVDVGAAGDVSESTPLAGEIDGFAIIVIRCAEELFAVEDRCTHDGEPLAGAQIESCEIICPRHGARFCARTGAALTPPAYEPLRIFHVREQDGRVLVETPE